MGYWIEKNLLLLKSLSLLQSSPRQKYYFEFGAAYGYFTIY